MFVPRKISAQIESGARQIPVIAVIGPRQSGKSTLIRTLFKNHVYLDMQDSDIFEFAKTDPKGFLNAHKSEYGIIIDEAQYAPSLFHQIKVEADKNPQPGYFVLSGSQNFLLYEKIGESLAGRVYFYTLLPFSINELNSSNLLDPNPREQIFKGFYPRTYQPNVKSQDYYENYVLTYVERDIRTIKNIDNIIAFKKFMQLCALRIGSTINFSDLATACGIAVNTAKSWLSLLEISFVLFQLPSYHENLGKRVTKSPKLYFYDVGLAMTLMGISKETMMKKQELFGALFENMVIIDIIKNFHAQGIRPSLTFFRDSNKNEIDLIIEYEGKTIPVEIKSTETIKSSFFETAAWFAKEAKTDQQPLIVYGGNKNQSRSQGKVVSWQQLDRILDNNQQD